MTSKPEFDESLTEAHDLALSALREITPASTIGPPAGFLVEDDGAVSLRFENRLPGYPGWYWTVTVARVGDDEPTVLEAELLPGDGALLAPEWVPWAERLAEYRAHQAELAEQAATATGEGDGDAEVDEVADDESSEDGDALDDADELDDDDELDEDELDDLSDEFDEDDLAPRLHAGDLDGVDIDELDDSVEDSEDEDLDGSSDDDVPDEEE